MSRWIVAGVAASCLAACSLLTSLDGFSAGATADPDGGAASDASSEVTAGGDAGPADGSSAPDGGAGPATPPTLVVVGGYDSVASTELDSVYSAVSNADGSLGPWRPGPKLPATLKPYGRVVSVGDTFFVLDGAQVLSSKRTADGVSSFTLETGYGDQFGACAAAMGGALVVMGGEDSNGATSRVRAARLGGGALEWKETPALPVPRKLHGCAASADFAFQVGGKDAAGGHQRTVFVARRGPDGLPAEWRATTNLPATSYWPHAVVVGQHLYVVGADWDEPLSLTSVIFAPIAADGSLGAWRGGPSLPKYVGTAAVSARGDRIAVAGGWDGDKSAKAVIIATVDLATGDLSAWTPTTELPVPATELGSAFLAPP